MFYFYIWQKKLVTSCKVWRHCKTSTGRVRPEQPGQSAPVQSAPIKVKSQRFILQALYLPLKNLAKVTKFSTKYKQINFF